LDHRTPCCRPPRWGVLWLPLPGLEPDLRGESSHEVAAMPTRKRSQRNWTFMVVPHDSGVTRAVRVPNLVVRTLLGIGGVMLLTIVVLGVAAIARGVNLTRYRGLEHTNRLLVEEIRHERGS